MNVYWPAIPLSAFHAPAVSSFHPETSTIFESRVAHDEVSMFFYAKTATPLSPPSDPNWMLLLIDSDGNPKTGWEGYDFVVNRSIDGKQTWLEQNTGGWNWKKVAPLQFNSAGNELMLQIPRAAMALPAGEKMSLDFKWWDNPQKSGEIMDTYLSGDAAPPGRFNFHYDAGGVPK